MGGGIVAGLLEQLDAACSEIDQQIAELTGERARLDAARQALAPGPVAAPATPPSPPTVQAERAAPRPSATFAASAVTPEDVLAFMSTLGSRWISMSEIAPTFQLTRKTIQKRLAALVAQGAVEQKGELGGRRYRVTGAAPDRQQPPPVPPTPPVSSRVRRQIEHENKPAPAPAPRTRPQGTTLREEIARRLARETLLPSDLARSLVVPMAEVSQQIAILRELGGQGRGPKVLKHESGAYFIEATAERAA